MTLTAFFTGIMVQTCLSIHKGVVRWEHSIRARQMLVASLHIMSRDVRMAGCNPFGTALFSPMEVGYGTDGRINGFTLRHDKRGKNPGTHPDGDIEDPDERIEYQLDQGILRRSHQPMAAGVSSNQDELPSFSFAEKKKAGLFHVFLTAGDRDPHIGLATSVCIRNPL